MKKHFTLFVPLMALFLTLSPQTAKAATYSGTVNAETPLTFYVNGSNFYTKIIIVYEGNWDGYTKPNFEWRQLGSTSDAATNWKAGASTAYKEFRWENTTYNFFWIHSTGNTSGHQNYGVQLRLASGSTWNCTKDRRICIKFCKSTTGTADVEICGNIMSLVDRDNYSTLTEIPSEYCFAGLFRDTTISGAGHSNVKANRLLLPATTLKKGCYERMFSGLGSYLQSGPQIMAFNPESDCATDCFKNMFNGCSAMTELTTSFLTWGSGAGTTNWLNGCSACTTVNCPSDLDVSTKDASHIGTAYTSGSGNVTPNVYIFKVAETNGTWPGGCTADKYITTSAPSVPTPVGTPSFAGWYSEDCVPTTLSTLLAPSGVEYYYAEFTGSVTVPYTITFKDENGNTVQTKNCRPGHIPSYTGTDLKKSGYDLSWFPAIVAATGNATYTATYVPKDYFTIKNNSAEAKSVTLKKAGSNAPNTKYHIRIYNPSTDNLSDWGNEITISSTTGTTWSIPAGGYIQFYGKNETLGSSSSQSKYTKFVLANNATSSFKISGNILYLVACSDGDNLEPFDMQSYCFYGLFDGHSCATLDAGELKLPSTKVASYGYAMMFNNCQKLTEAPKELPATDLGTYCYQCMFQTCSSLKKAPEILYEGSTNPSYVFNQMFSGCSNLNYVRTYHRVWTGSNAFTSWMNSVNNSGVFYCSPDLSNSTFGAANVPKSTTYKWIVYSYDVTFKVKSGGNWVDGSHFDWKEDVSVITGFLDTEDDAETEFFTDADCAEAHKVSITDIKNALPRVANTTPQPAKTYYMRKKVVTYSLAWNTNGGSELAGTYTSGDVEAGEAITAPADPTKSGFVFAGWKDENDNDFTGFMPAANTTYTAQWKHEYTITTTCDNGSVALTANGYTPQNGSGTYLEGTTLTMSVTLNDGYRFVRWNDNDTQNPRAITVSEDASYTAITEIIPTHWARFYDDDGTTLRYEVEVREGTTPVYGGTEPDKYGYVFAGWTPAISEMGASDATYTAMYAAEPNFFTITNNHVSASTTVSMVRNNANSPTPIVYVRIYNADHTLQSGWTQKNINGNKDVSNVLGTIPHGGKMQIYGATGTEFAYTTNQDYWVRFSLSGGTPEASGNILSLTSCSVDRKTIGTVNTWPAYYFTNLFYNCSALVSAENLEMPATTLGDNACRYMFGGCTSLTKAPKTLPAATIGDYSYMFMFYNCSTLVKSPDIHATSITTSGHHSMFLNCVALRQIRTYNTIWETTQITSSFTDWVKNTTLGGAFYCPPTLPRESANFGTYGIPVYSNARWIVYSYDVTFVPLECTWSSAPNSGNRQFTWETDVVNVTNFLTAESAANAQFYESDGTTPVSAETIISRLSSETSARTYKVRKVSSYTLAWDANGGALSGDYSAAGDYEAGATITAPTAILAGYTYTWDPAFTGTMPAANTTYTAQWTQKSYTLNATASAGGSGVTRSDNGSSETVKRYGDNVVLTPVANTGYHFTDWTGTDADDLVDNEDGTYTLTIADKADNYEYAVTANFAPNTHRLTWTTDGNTLTGDYTHGEAIAYGTTVTAPDTPTKNATAEYTYTFSAWSPDVAGTMPDKDVEYTATWTETKRQYTLTWDVNGGNALTGIYTNGTIDWGTDIVKPANPTRTDYTFGGWDANNDGKADEVAKTMPTTSLTYKAIWVAELPNITLCENCDNDHYNTFKTNYNGETVNVTYPRQFSASKWSTMCLPFSLDLATMIANKMYGRVYEFKYATGNANTNSGVNLYFSNAKKIEAGKCYIVNANDALAAKTSFVFSGVTIDLSKDNGAALTSVGAYNNLPGYKSEGTIELVGTLRNGTLHGMTTGNTYMGLKDNKIYYPNISQGSTIWAYRGIFRSSEFLDKESMQKMRIIVDGEDRGEIIIDADGDVRAPSDAASRKFIRDGVLYIEREGVVYDAQGKRVEQYPLTTEQRRLTAEY